MGTEYQIGAEADWEQVSKVVRATKDLIKSTQPRSTFLTRGDNEIEDNALRGVLVPQEQESFMEYRNRFNQVYVGSGLRLNDAFYNYTTKENLPDYFINEFSDYFIWDKYYNILKNNFKNITIEDINREHHSFIDSYINLLKKCNEQV